MKNIQYIKALSFLLLGLPLLMTSCRKNLLDQYSEADPSTNTFWTRPEDARLALIGNYAAFRPCFERDYHFDGHGDFLKMWNVGAAPISMTVNNPSSYGNGASALYRALYGSIANSNYIIENARDRLLPKATTPQAKATIETVIGEAKLLRGIAYFRLISLWGDVPYMWKGSPAPIDADTISRMPITQIKDSIMADFTYAVDHLPEDPVEVGRAGRPAAYAFRGKMQLYWASWKKNGWPELEGFTQSASEAQASYAAAAADFKSIITNPKMALFRNGDPGQWGEMGKADILPNYFYMFIPSTGNVSTANPYLGGEMLMVLTHGDIAAKGQAEEYVRVWTGPGVALSQNQAIPRWELADRYQSTITGDFLPKMTQLNPGTVADARTRPNSSLNPESYRNRDYRMKATLLWDYEKIMGMSPTAETGYLVFRYKTWTGNIVVDGVTYPAFADNGTNLSGLQSRKFVRNYAGLARNEGNYNWPLMRLADVYLMYAEATNEVNGPQADAIELVNKVRRRGNLPALSAAKTANKNVFFDAIEQERIVELFGEGQRAFDLRRWRKLETVFGQPYGEGKWFYDSYGVQWERFFFQASELVYQRCYIYQIPEDERARNSNLSQNTPWM
ncbi:Starch-binding associating with outer membrane [Sphingobacterium nematocida]|uniref:Starch-binding associating with outer membrane n=1 Tax=Sphingobacterium nematocida TaxID=1513896 RepID=A0A1T5DXR4_9SPHI|nr:RagB/SusD family nutrient uptake outer membrane protein [Sphingobacterium nematocida]SKB76379.1 Starch-binding associating with outer membrane [Sphingobacterium nematocida]